MTTLDLTPSWQDAVKILITVLDSGTEQGKKEAKAQLLDMAEFTQRASEFYRAAKARIDGEWDNPLLIKFGLLHVDEDKDLARMIKEELNNIV